MRDGERMHAASMLAGHIDTSPVLVVKRVTSPKQSLGTTFWKYFSPFSWDLWVMIVLLIFTSGGVDYLLEREAGGKLSTRPADHSVFAKHAAKADQSMTFTNLGGDATLVCPAPPPARSAFARDSISATSRR